MIRKLGAKRQGDVLGRRDLQLQTSEGHSRRDRVVLFDIRLPRLALGLAVGAALAVSGVLLQGLIRKPLADPEIVEVSAGAGLGVVLAIVLGGLLPAGLAAGLGGWATTRLLYRVATNGKRTEVATTLLADIALSALAGSALSGWWCPISCGRSRGPDHRQLLPNTALLGAGLLELADLCSRTIVAPAELPIGIVTALSGAPIFLWVLVHNAHLRGRRHV